MKRFAMYVAVAGVALALAAPGSAHAQSLKDRVKKATGLDKNAEQEQVAEGRGPTRVEFDERVVEIDEGNIQEFYKMAAYLEAEEKAAASGEREAAQRAYEQAAERYGMCVVQYQQSPAFQQDLIAEFTKSENQGKDNIEVMRTIQARKCGAEPQRPTGNAMDRGTLDDVGYDIMRERIIAFLAAVQRDPDATEKLRTGSYIYAAGEFETIRRHEDRLRGMVAEELKEATKG